MAYDAVDRLESIWISPLPHGASPHINFASYVHVGHRPRVRYSGWIRSEFIYNGSLGAPNTAGDHGIDRPGSVRHRRVLATAPLQLADPFDSWLYRWDKADNRTARDDLSPIDPLSGSAWNHTYEYDSVNRLIGSARRAPASAPADPPASNTAYAFDAALNLVQVAESFDSPASVEGQGVQVGDFILHDAPPLHDARVNQYSSSPLEDFEYDPSGNLVSIRPRGPPRAHRSPLADGAGALPPHARPLLAELFDSALRHDPGDGALSSARDALLGQPPAGTPAPRDARLVWDWRGNLVEYTDLAHDPPRRHLYRYDALGRRVLKIVDADSPASELRTTRFVHGGRADAEWWQVLEEHRPIGADPGDPWRPATSFVHGLPGRADELLLVWRAPGLPGGGPAEGPGREFVPLQDDLATVTSIAEPFGGVVERYRYGDYGAVVVLDPDGTPRGDASTSILANTRFFAGRELDTETGLYQFRRRVLDPSLGRFISRDPIGVWGDPLNLGNAYAYAAQRPWTMADPTGLYTEVSEVPGWKDGNRGTYYHTYDRGWTGLFKNKLIDSRFVADETEQERRAKALRAEAAARDLASAGGDIYSDAKAYGERSKEVIQTAARKIGDAADTLGYTPVGAATNLAAGGIPVAGAAAKAVGRRALAGACDDAANAARTARRGYNATDRKKYDTLVNAARKEYPHYAGRFENHHITPRYLGGDPNGPMVRIDKAYHQKITNEFRAQWGYGKGIPSEAQRAEIMRKVYEKYPLPAQ